jgi:K+-transporting ATPase ATPase C chain
MTSVLQLFRINVSLLLFSTLIFGLAYPLVCLILLQGIFPHQAEGCLIRDGKGHILGSELIGQYFTQPHYLWGRPSATAPEPYNASASGGSNLNPANPQFLERVRTHVSFLKKGNDLENPEQAIPVDLVTASASGLDPHISYASALYQVRRIAKARHMTEHHVLQIIDRFSIFQDRLGGQYRVNVLLVNLALDGHI